MASHSRRQAIAAVLGALCVGALPLVWSDVAAAQDTRLSKTAGGMTVYVGVVPAEIVQGLGKEQPMHDGVPKGAHQYHLVAAVFDAAGGARVVDAAVNAQISGIGLSGEKKKLEPMQIANTTSYGGFFDLPGRDLYTIRLTIERPGQPRPVDMEFKYDHRH
jgi:hypothetical protein